jgi:hypothetical protein
MQTIYGIFSNGNIKKYDTFENSIKSGALFVCNAIYEKTDSSSQVYKYEIQFYDSTLTSINLAYGNWKLNSRKFTFTVNLERPNNIKLNLVDRYGQIEAIEINQNKVLDIIKSINESLKNLSSYNSWDEYRLKQENDFLKSEIERLKK